MRRTLCLRVALAAAAGVAFLVPAPSFAATDPATPAEGASVSAPASQTDAQAKGQITQLSRLVVFGQLGSASYRIVESSTAAGIETPTLDIPQSIQIIPRQLLVDQNADSLEDAMRNAPGVYVQQGEGNRDEFFIRGVKSKSDFFVDGLRDDSWYYRPLYNVAHVDVLLGPDAILFGRGGAGGVINLVTRKPQRKAIRHASIHVGSWQQKRATLDVGNALGDAGAFRVMAMGEYSGGFRQDYYLHRWAVNPEFGFQLGDRTQLDISLSRLDDFRFDDRGIPSQNGRPADVPRDRLFGSPDWNKTHSRVQALRVRLAHQFNDQLTLRNAFLATRNDRYYQMAYPGSAVTPSDEVKLKAYRRNSAQLSYLERIELVAGFDTGALSQKLVLGTEYSWQDGSDQQFLPEKDSKTLPGMYPIANPTVPPVALPYVEWNNRATGKELGLYALDQLSVGRHWKGVIGVRWDRFSVDAQYLKPGVTPPNISNVDARWSPRVGLIYKPVENDSLYASVTQTFTPQGSGVAMDAKHRDELALDPLEATNYEIGNKVNLLGGKLAITAALFQLDLDDVASKAPGTGLLVNTGSQRNRGFQLAVEGAITSQWSLYANYTHLDAEITSTTEDAEAGATVGLVPSNAFSIWARYEPTQHWGFGAGLRGESKKYTTFDNKVVLPGYVVADLMAYYQTGRYRVQLNIGNITDKSYYPTASDDNEIMPGEPRNVSLSLSAYF